ncbi:MAG: cytochrome c, partial [Verrucomicrobiae bacterium]|nr:cytochrome c [Verrucomicrobiae bacterium]NNJ85548.1 cytochrome c [Akkermansiaceae bacterium]
MSEPSTNKPDLDDNTNVITDAAAAKRENHMFTQGAEPLSLWVILGGALIVLIAGGVIGNTLFDYDSFVKSNYTRDKAPGAADVSALPKPALDAYMKVGKKGYTACAGCHQPGGEGNNDYPPLANSEWVTGPSLRPALIILNGLHESIIVNGKTYNGNMPSMGSGMDAKQLAGVLNYIRNSFGNKSEQLISLEMAQNAIDISKERNGGQMTASELDAKYNKDLEGTPLAPDTPVDPKTLL